MLTEKIIRKVLISCLTIKYWIISNLKIDKNNSIYLTYDDGPHERYTMELLDLLNRYNAKATFFCVGKNMEKNINVVEAMHVYGHSVQNHSYSHRNFSEISYEEAKEEISRCRLIIESITGKSKERYFRPPHGLISLKNIIAVNNCNEKMLFWSSEIDASGKLKVNNIRPGIVILQHDDERNVVKNTQVILENAIQCGLTIRGIVNNNTLQNG